MHLTALICWATLLGTGLADGIQRQNTEFGDMLKKPDRDLTGREGDPKNKYFHESTFHSHYDGRFSDHVLDYDEQQRSLKSLVQTYLATFASIGVETWLMHGSLLGWWWNKQILPWDSDIDVQVLEPSMYYLAAYYNMSTFHYKTSMIPEGRDYLLEINPNYVNTDQSDNLNVIDARWIDTATGLFIDITTARYNVSHPAGEGMLCSKDGHEYRDTYLFPLRETFFEETPVKIPYKYRDILESEYGLAALYRRFFNNYVFDESKMEWVVNTETHY